VACRVPPRGKSSLRSLLYAQKAAGDLARDKGEVEGNDGDDATGKENCVDSI